MTVFITPSICADTQQKGFFSRSIRKLESLLDKSSSNPLEYDSDIGTRLNAEQKQLLHLNRALLYYLSGELNSTRAYRLLAALGLRGLAITTFCSSAVLWAISEAAKVFLNPLSCHQLLHNVNPKGS